MYINSPCSRAPVYDYPLGRLAFFSFISGAAGPTRDLMAISIGIINISGFRLKIILIEI